MGCIFSSPEVSPPGGSDGRSKTEQANIFQRLQLYCAGALKKKDVVHKVSLSKPNTVPLVP